MYYVPGKGSRFGAQLWGSEITNVIERLLRSQELVVEQADVHDLALGLYKVASMGFSDAVIAQAGQRAGCTETVTFDRRAAKGTTIRLLADIEWS